MLESAEIGHKISKAAYAHEAPRLREALLNAQYDLAQSGRGPVLLIISGVEGADAAGKRGAIRRVAAALEAEDKLHARLKILRTIARRLEAALA